MQVVVDGLVHDYSSDVRALDSVTLTVPARTRLALLGENGAGKTTLVKHWNGLLKPTAGTVTIGGEAPTPRHVGYMFQNPDDQLFGRHVAREVEFGPRQLGVRGGELERRVQDALRQVGLSDAATRHPFDLDLPQRKLLALACVLAMEPSVLILDEPTSGLDAPAVSRVTEIITSLEDTTVAVITHDIDWAAEIADRFVVMESGKIVADGTGAEVLTASSIRYLADGLGMSPELVRTAPFVEAWRTR